MRINHTYSIRSEVSYYKNTLSIKHPTCIILPEINFEATNQRCQCFLLDLALIELFLQRIQSKCGNVQLERIIPMHQIEMIKLNSAILLLLHSMKYCKSRDKLSHAPISNASTSKNTKSLWWPTILLSTDGNHSESDVKNYAHLLLHITQHVTV